MADAAVWRLMIQRKQGMIDQLNREIEEIVKVVIPDYHFLNYAVSTFWRCDKSPVGMCLFVVDDYGHKTYCRYCNGPVERK